MPRPRPQRVIWITTDHMRYDHIAANGNPGMVTPALDRLVEHGVNFHNCFTQNPVCMPSRCSFMTGLDPQQTGVTNNGHCLPPDFEPTVARAFKAGGYMAAQIGKLHFQPHDNLDYNVAPRHTGWIVETARDFFKSRRDNDVFMHLGFYNPHPPLTPSRRPHSPARSAHRAWAWRV